MFFDRQGCLINNVHLQQGCRWFFELILCCRDFFESRCRTSLISDPLVIKVCRVMVSDMTMLCLCRTPVPTGWSKRVSWTALTVNLTQPRITSAGSLKGCIARISLAFGRVCVVVGLSWFLTDAGTIPKQAVLNWIRKLAEYTPDCKPANRQQPSPVPALLPGRELSSLVGDGTMQKS